MNNENLIQWPRPINSAVILESADETIVAGEWLKIRNDIRRLYGCPIVSFSELVTTPSDISFAFPIILNYILTCKDPHLMSSLARSLMEPRYYHLLDIPLLTKRYKEFEDTWVGTYQTGGKGSLGQLISLALPKSEYPNI